MDARNLCPSKAQQSVLNLVWPWRGQRIPTTQRRLAKCVVRDVCLTDNTTRQPRWSEGKMAAFDEKQRSSLNLRAMGFCGVDDSVDPALLQLISTRYSWVEWGVLFRPGRTIRFSLVIRKLTMIDLESTPRYPSWQWVQRLGEVNKENGSIMRLAGHLCQSRCQEVGSFPRFSVSLSKIRLFLVILLLLHHYISWDFLEFK
jgi:hypothetical protein